MTGTAINKSNEAFLMKIDLDGERPFLLSPRPLAIDPTLNHVQTETSGVPKECVKLPPPTTAGNKK
jgi:hypothetical protein